MEDAEGMQSPLPAGPNSPTPTIGGAGGVISPSTGDQTVIGAASVFDMQHLFIVGILTAISNRLDRVEDTQHSSASPPLVQQQCQLFGLPAN